MRYGVLLSLVLDILFKNLEFRFLNLLPSTTLLYIEPSVESYLLLQLPQIYWRKQIFYTKPYIQSQKENPEPLFSIRVKVKKKLNLEFRSPPN